MKIDLLGQTGAAISRDVLYQKTQNLYPAIEQQGKSQLVLYPTPGLTQFTNVGIGEIRGGIDFDGTLFIVSNNTLYSVTSAGTATAISTVLNTTSGRISLAHNGKGNAGQILIVDGTNGYIYNNSTGALAVITDPDFPDNATTCAFMDGYFFVNEPDVTGRFRMSNLYDGTAWNTNDFDTAERSSDALQAIVVANRIAWMLGTHTAEPHQNLGSVSGTVLEPIQSGFSQWGCIAPHSAIEVAGVVLWLSQNNEGSGMVLMADGLSPTTISQSIVNDLQDLTTLSDAYAWAYQYKGHTFYVLTFPTDGKTFVYDLSTQMWHEWSDASLGYHRSSMHIFIYGKHIVGDPENNKLYYLDWDKYTDDGRTITRLRRSRVIHGEGKGVRHFAVFMDAKTGVGNDDITDPQIMMRFLDDGHKWSNERWRSLGKIGEADTRCIWRRLGRSRDRVYEFKVTDPCNVVLIQAHADVDLDSKELG